MIKKKNEREVKVYGLSDYLIKIIHLPESLIDTLQELNGNNMTLDTLLNKLALEAKGIDGIIAISRKEKIIGFKYNNDDLWLNILRYK